VTPAAPLWALRSSARRAIGEWKLLLVITAVALIACSLITSLGVLVTATEREGIRTELTASTDTSIDLTIINPSADIASTTDAAADAVQATLGGSASAALTSSVARTGVFESPPLSTSTKKALVYAGEYSAIRDHTSVVTGEWPTAPGDIAIPDAAATSLDLALGDTVTVSALGDLVDATVVATYASTDPTDSFWSDDTLQGAGFNDQFPLPDSRVFIPTNAFGPVLFAPGGIDAAGIPFDRADLSFQPSFDSFDSADLPGLTNRLGDVYQNIPAAMGNVATLVVVFTDLGEVTGAAASDLVVTRSTVVVTSLLLMVLAVAALAQTARLLFEARIDERRLMQLRGASRRQVLLLAFIEALAIGVIIVALSPLLATFVYAALAAQPPMVEAGMPAWVGLSGIAFATAGAVALVFVVILVAPLLRPSRLESPRGTRQRRFSGLMSSGLDIGLVVIAIVAYWQLNSYRSPIEHSSSPRLDPLLVAGPAITLLAGALLSVRFIPVGSRLLDRLASRSPGVLLPLASWEVARRTQRAIAAVLLLTLALAVATFGLSFLASWKQSQVDQADVAVGAPLRVPAVVGSTFAQEVELGDERGNPQPVTRRQGTIAGPTQVNNGIDLPSGTAAVVMGLTPDARELIARGRPGDEGGDAVVAPLKTDLPPSTAIDLEGDVRGISATVQVGDDETTIPGAGLEVHAVLENANGLLSTLSLGTALIDGTPTTLSGQFDQELTSTMRIVGFQFQPLVVDSGEHRSLTDDVATTIRLGDLAALQSDDLTPTQVVVPADEEWYISSTARFSVPPELNPATSDWQFDATLAIPGYIDTIPTYIVISGWSPNRSMAAVMTDDLAHVMNVTDGELVTVVSSGAAVPVVLEALTPLIPGSGAGTALSPADQTVYGTIAVDQAALFRALVVEGVSELPLDEWWLGVPTGTADSYLSTHADVPGVADAVSTEVLARDLQQGPLRVATQAALWLAIIAAAILAAIGFAVHTAATLRSRNTELAQLRAIGFSRRSLVALVGVESALLAALGTIFGVTLGVLLGYLVGPLIAVSPSGRPTVPAVIVDIPWLSVALLVVELAAVLALVVGVVARAQKGSDPAGILRAGG
jgi:ABC-type antimicrobial peptide transport system permease subunit